MGSRGRMDVGNYRNPCLTMHQPWASLLVFGIKRIEGRSWPAPIRGRLWIHSASKVPEPETIKAMEDFYQEIYAVNGVTDIKFPEHYPVSRLIGCVEVVGCIKCEELVRWDEVPEGVRLEGQTAYCWLCEQPQKLVIPFEMRGFQGVYNLERKIYEAAIRGLSPAIAPLPVKFPLPDPKDPFSLKPGSILPALSASGASEVRKSASLAAAITGARTAATQFSKRSNFQAPAREEPISTRTRNKSKADNSDHIEWLALGEEQPEISTETVDDSFGGSLKHKHNKHHHHKHHSHDGPAAAPEAEHHRHRGHKHHLHHKKPESPAAAPEKPVVNMAAPSPAEANLTEPPSSDAPSLSTPGGSSADAPSWLDRLSGSYSDAPIADSPMTSEFFV